MKELPALKDKRRVVTRLERGVYERPHSDVIGWFQCDGHCDSLPIPSKKKCIGTIIDMC